MPWKRGRRSSRSSRSVVRDSYEPLRCPVEAYSRTKARPTIRTPGFQFAVLVALIALLLAAVPATNWVDMRAGAARLRSNDLAGSLTAPDPEEYEKRLTAVQDATGESMVNIAAMTEMVAEDLKKESGRDVTCLSVLDAAVAITETRASGDERASLSDQFDTVRDRLAEMYERHGGTVEKQAMVRFP